MAAKSNNKKALKEQNSIKQDITPVQRDIFVLIVLGVAVLLFVSVIGFCGIIGVGLRFILFGLMGMPAFALPFILFFGAVYYLANKGNPLLKRKLIGLIGLFVLVCAFCQIAMSGYDPTYSVFQCFLDSADDHLGGGLIGGIIVQLLCMLIDVAGTYIVLIIGMVIFAIILTQKPLVSKMRDETKHIYKKAKDTRTKAIERRKLEEAMAAQRAAEYDYDENDIGYPTAESSPSNQDSVFDAYLNGKFNKEETVHSLDIELPKIEIPEDMINNNENEKSLVNDNDMTPIDISESLSDIDEDEEYNNDSHPDMINDDPVKHESAAHQSAVTSAKSENGFVVSESDKNKKSGYRLPPVSLLNKGRNDNKREMNAHVKETAMKLQQTLHNFGVEATVINASCGPTVTRYELQPDQGVKVSKIVALTDDIKLNLAAADIRIEAPIPGKAAVGIEVPNKTNNSVALRELIDTPEFRNHKSKLSFAVGKDLAGKPVISDIAKMPHLLIAGSTGSGKSVCINTLIMSILYKATPDEVRFIMIDPKVVELSVYNGIPHLLSPVVTDPKKAAGALQWAVVEMTRRYNLFAEFQVRDIKGYNNKAGQLASYANEDETAPEILPQIVIIVDELADLMMAAPGEVEDAICRLAQLARAAGLHLIIATQRPSVNVITGLIKANMPSRIALSVTSGIDSRVIIDMNGAEKLLGKGDMLFYPAGYQKPARVQGGFVSDEEIQKVVDYISKEDAQYDPEISAAFETSSASIGNTVQASKDDRDMYFADAGKFIIEKDKASIGMLQRVFKIGFNRAARIMDQLCEAGVVGEEESTKPRKILMSMEQFENYLEEN